MFRDILLSEIILQTSFGTIVLVHASSAQMFYDYYEQNKKALKVQIIDSTCTLKTRHEEIRSSMDRMQPRHCH